MANWLRTVATLNFWLLQIICISSSGFYIYNFCVRQLVQFSLFWSLSFFYNLPYIQYDKYLVDYKILPKYYLTFSKLTAVTTLSVICRTQFGLTYTMAWTLERSVLSASYGCTLSKKNAQGIQYMYIICCLKTAHSQLLIEGRSGSSIKIFNII